MKGQKGLTLMELLIVIAIIAALAGLLFPVFMSVRERAWITHCINSLKQVGDALHMYAQDYDGFAPPFSNYVGASEHINPLYLPNANSPALFEAAYAPYTKDKQIWYCPLDPFAGIDTPAGPPDWAIQYSPTWAAFYWNTINHKATSYGIDDTCAMKPFAPVRVDTPPTYRQYYAHTGVTMSRANPDSPMPYACDFCHSEPSGKSIGIYLNFDGSVKSEVSYD